LPHTFIYLSKRHLKGPAAEEGRRRISAAKLKHGLKSNEAIAERLKCSQLRSDTRDMLESIQCKIDLWGRMESGEEEAIFELTEEVFGEEI
jgi:hypothetical protein